MQNGHADDVRTLIAALELMRAVMARVLDGQAQLDAKIDLLLSEKRGGALSRADRAYLSRLLPATAGALGSHPFTSRELADSRAPGLRLIVGDMSPKKIGRLLTRAEGEPIDGFVVVRQGVELNVTLWRIMAC